MWEHLKGVGPIWSRNKRPENFSQRSEDAVDAPQPGPGRGPAGPARLETASWIRSPRVVGGPGGSLVIEGQQYGPGPSTAEQSAGHHGGLRCAEYPLSSDPAGSRESPDGPLSPEARARNGLSAAFTARMERSHTATCPSRGGPGTPVPMTGSFGAESRNWKRQ